LFILHFLHGLLNKVFMDFRRTILWVVFLMSGMFLVDGWQRFNGGAGFMGVPNKPAASAAAGTSNTTSSPTKAADAVPASPVAAVKTSTPTDASTVATVATAPLQTIKLANDVLAIEVSSAGANIVRAELLKHRAENDIKANVVLLEGGNKPYFAQTGLLGSTASGAALPNHTAQMVYTVASSSADKVVLESTIDGVKLTKTIALTAGSYNIAVNHSVSNASTAAITPSLYLQLLRHGAAVTEGNAITQPTSTFTGPAVYTEEKKFQKIEFTEIEKGKAKFQNTSKDGEPTWVAMVQHYFVSAWVAKENKARELEVDAINGADGGRHYRVRSKQSLGSIPVGATVSHDATLYVGPQDQDALEKLSPGLDLVVDYGILTIVAKPMFAALKFFHNLSGNWGWAIVLLTVSIKALLYLPMAMSYRSMAKMKLVAPKMKALQERHADDKTKLNGAMMELYKTEKINPLGGCLPILLTIPIFIALYWVLLASVEMRNAPWIGWITNLAVPDQWYVLPVLLAATMWAQFKLSPTPPDPMQARVMMIMQGVFAIMFLFFPAGLNLYYFVNNLLSIAQQKFITMQLEKEGLQEKVVKPTKLKR
jgi:YidC/Oxa1 family membrane protein insertase